MRALHIALALSITLVAAAAAPSAAAAQELVPAASSPPAMQIDLDELASINTEADVATALYVTGLVLHIGGLGAAAATAISNICISFSSSDPCHSHHEPVFALLITSGVGLLTVFTAIGLDVDSGSRRSRLYRDARLELSAAPLDGGGVVSVRGTF